MDINTQALVVVAALEVCLAAPLLFKVKAVVEARMQRVKRMQKALDIKQQHAQLMHESCQLRIQAKGD